MKRILLILLALTLILLPGCAEEPDTDNESKSHTSRVVSKYMAEYGNYIYISETFGLCRYNRKTGEMIPYCTDPECDGSCVFESPFFELTQIADGRLYFNCNTNWTHENVYAYLDLVTEEVKVLLYLPENETAEVSPPVLDNGYLYYTAQRLRKGGDVTNPDDYEPYVGRIPMDGGEPEFVCTIAAGWGELLCAVVDGKIVTNHRHCFYITDSATNEREVLFDPEEYGFFRFIDKINYLDGYFYVLCGSSEYFESEYYSVPLRKSYLIKIDAETGEMIQPLEEPVCGLIVTDDTIYYTEQTIRELYVPMDYVDHPEKVVVSSSYETIYACDLDGKNPRAVYSDPYLNVDYINRIIDNCLYGWISVYDETEHKLSDRFFAKLDFATGEITPATYVD
ncbi:MAG: hypothetical protein IJF49_00790 [Clostridia bacterium]|nr:hypothetical protein [Clostridia bacterium]